MHLFRRRRSRWAGVDFLALRPERAVDFDRDEPDEQVILLVPRFRSGLLGRWLQPRLAPERAHIRVRLEERGSWIWRQCDGRRTVADIVTGFLASFPADREQADQRVCRFLYHLAENRFVSFVNLNLGD